MFFENNYGILYNKDFLDLEVEKESIDLMVTDVPYGVGYRGKSWDTPEFVISCMGDWIAKMYAVLKEGSHCYIFVPTIGIDNWVGAVKQKGFIFKNLLSVSVFPIQHHRFSNNFIYDNQLVIFAHKGKGKNLNEINWVKTSNSWLKDKRNPNPKEYSYKYPAFIRRELGRGNVKANAKVKLLHPNQKSGELISKFIQLSSNENDVVADFFCGSGTILVEAQKLKRRWVGNDFDAECCKITKSRILELK